MRGLSAIAVIVIFLAGCGGGGGSPIINPPPQAPNVAGLWSATYHVTSGAGLVPDRTSPLVLLPSGIDTYRFVDSDGIAYGNLNASPSTFSTAVTTTDTEGTGVYSATMTLTGALTASSLNGGGQYVIALVSGIDSSGLDGRTLNVTFTAVRQGPVPSGTATNLAGTWMIQLHVLNPPAGEDLDGSGNITLSLREPNIYDITGTNGKTTTALIVIGTTWYMLNESDSPASGTDYSMQMLLSGTLATNSFTGGGTIEWTSQDGTDNAGLDGVQVQATYQAARVN
jgi:hypothetical protein